MTHNNPTKLMVNKQRLESHQIHILICLILNPERKTTLMLPSKYRELWLKYRLNHPYTPITI
jgi:hypothetical protein